MIITYEDLEAHEGHLIGINKEGQHFYLVCVDDGYIFWRMRPTQKSSTCCPSCQETFMYKPNSQMNSAEDMQSVADST